MKDGEYLFILLDGFVNHREYLANYYWRKAKKAEEEHITFYEFFDRMIKGCQTFENAIRDEISSEQHKLFMFIDQCYQKTNEQNKQEMDDKINEINELMKNPSGQYHENNISLHLPTYTQNKFFGQLHLIDVTEMRTALKGAIEIIERQSQTPQDPPPKVSSLRFDEVKAIFDKYKFFDEIPELRQLNKSQKERVLSEIASPPDKEFIAQFVRCFKLDKVVRKKDALSNDEEAFKKLVPLGCSVSYMKKATYEHEKAGNFMKKLMKESD